LNGDVHAIAYHAGKVYVGGVFTNAGGDANLDFVAVWNGAKWGPACAASGPVVTANVNALQIIGSTLYIGGSFANGAGIDSADFLLARNLATGAPSSTMLKDGDCPGAVYALTADSTGTLYAGAGSPTWPASPLPTTSPPTPEVRGTPWAPAAGRAAARWTTTFAA
jgi:hypothetical protein